MFSEENRRNRAHLVEALFVNANGASFRRMPFHIEKGKDAYQRGKNVIQFFPRVGYLWRFANTVAIILSTVNVNDSIS